MGRESILAVVIASGFSRRYGSNKLNDDLGGMTLLERAVYNAAHSSCSAVLVVMPEEADEPLAFDENVTIVRNRNRREGISSSVKAALSGAGRDYDGFLFLVADQPFASPTLLDRIASEFRKGSCGIIACTTGSDIRNPMLFSAAYSSELLSIQGDTGARQVALSHKNDVALVRANHEWELMDIDTPDDMLEARKIMKKMGKLDSDIV